LRFRFGISNDNRPQRSSAYEKNANFEATTSSQRYSALNEEEKKRSLHCSPWSKSSISLFEGSSKELASSIVWGREKFDMPELPKMEASKIDADYAGVKGLNHDTLLCGLRALDGTALATALALKAILKVECS
jgi:hypothetical protein